MGKNQSFLVNWSQYLALRGVAGFVQCFDPDENLHTAATIGSMFYRASRERRRRAERNIALSFPDWPRERVEAVCERSMQHLFQVFLVDAFMMTRLITPASWPDWVQFGVQEPASKAVYSKGYADAEKRYRIDYRCSVCNGRLTINHESSKRAAATYMRERGWAHGACQRQMS